MICRTDQKNCLKIAINEIWPFRAKGFVNSALPLWVYSFHLVYSFVRKESLSIRLMEFMIGDKFCLRVVKDLSSSCVIESNFPSHYPSLSLRVSLINLLVFQCFSYPRLILPFRDILGTRIFLLEKQSSKKMKEGQCALLGNWRKAIKCCYSSFFQRHKKFSSVPRTFSPLQSLSVLPFLKKTSSSTPGVAPF